MAKGFLPKMVSRLMLGVVLLVASGLAQDAPDLLRQAEEELRKEDYAAAARTLESYLSQQPEDHRAEFNLAYAYSLTGRRAEAIRRYRNVLSRQKDLVAAHRNLGLLLLEDGQAEEAVEHLQFVADKQPDNMAVTRSLAEALAATGRTDEARLNYGKLLQQKPDDMAALLAVSRLLRESDANAAADYLRRALQADPTLDDARLSLAALLWNMAVEGADTLGEAERIYREYLEDHTDRSDLHLRLGQIYGARERWQEAAAQFEAARAAGGLSAEEAKELNQELLQAYLRIPEKDKAAALVEELAASEQNNAEWHLLAGTLRMEQKRYGEAAQEFLKAAQINPQSAESFTNLASAVYLLGNYQATVGALQKVTELGQDTAGTYFLRALSLDKLGLARPALENYQRFLETTEGKNPDQEFQARQRIKVLSLEIRKGL